MLLKTKQKWFCIKVTYRTYPYFPFQRDCLKFATKLHQFSFKWN